MMRIPSSLHPLQTELQELWFGALRGSGYTPQGLQSAMATWYGMGKTSAERLDFDRLLALKYSDVLSQASDGAFGDWKSTSSGLLSLCILVDQLSRNIHRGSPLAFAADNAMAAAATQGIKLGLHKEVHLLERSFIMLPLMHSEDMADHQFAKVAYEDLLRDSKLANQELFVKNAEVCLAFLEKHSQIIRQFGRYPHRNKVLGRANTSEEDIYMASPSYDSFGQ